MKAVVISSNVCIIEKIKALEEKFEDMDFTYSDTFLHTEFDLYLISEIVNFDQTQDLIGDIKNITKKKRAVIIIIGDTEKPFNVVKWMRSGVADYLLIEDLVEDILKDSIIGSFKYIFGDLKSIPGIINVNTNYGKRVVVKKNNDWKTLINNKTYPMSLVLVNIIFPDDATGRYSKKSKEMVVNIIKDEVNRVAENFGGSLWFWNGDSGVMSFHFDDYINSSILASIYLMGHFFLFCVEKLKLNEILKIKLSVHKGNCLYNKQNTEQITSDLINSIVHLQNQYNTAENLYITEDIYTGTSTRLSEYFEKLDFFEGKMIYRLMR